MTKLAPASRKQEMMLGADAQITVIGGAAGSGKSYIMNMIPLRYVDCPHFRGIVFRRETTQLTGEGGMWDTATEIYSELPKDIRPKILKHNLRMIFPNGAKIKFSHMENDNDFRKHQGLQYTLICFDEATHFTFQQVEYLMSRMRSKSKYTSRMVLSCNPDPDSWLLPMIEWYLDEQGYPDQSKDGVVRWFIRKNGEFIWRDTEEEIYRDFGTGPSIRPVSFTFISANIYDNPIMIETNPDYLAMLEGLNEVDKARLLKGNWYARPQDSGYFKRDWLQRCVEAPADTKWVRAWDKAATEPSDTNPSPDYTACIKMGKDRAGNYYIAGDFVEENYDEDSKTYGRFRKRAGARDNIILKQALADGHDCEVILPQDPAAAGKTEYIESAKKLIEQGIRCRKDVVAPNKSKLIKFSPFSASCENGLVYILDATFTQKTLNAFYTELESFNGEASTRTRKDDWVDCTAMAFNYLSKKSVLPNFTLDEWGGTSVKTPLSIVRANFH